MKIYDKIDLIQSEKDFRHVMSSLAGNIYAKCAMFRMIYENIQDNKELEAYKAEYKTGKPCKSFAMNGIWTD